MARRTVRPKITKDGIEDALRLIRDVLNEISLSRDGTSIYYERPIAEGDGTDIVYALKFGQRLHTLNERAWRGEAPATLIEEFEEILVVTIGIADVS